MLLGRKGEWLGQLLLENLEKLKEGLQPGGSWGADETKTRGASWAGANYDMVTSGFDLPFDNGCRWRLGGTVWVVWQIWVATWRTAGGQMHPGGEDGRVSCSSSDTVGDLRMGRAAASSSSCGTKPSSSSSVPIQGGLGSAERFKLEESSSREIRESVAPETDGRLTGVCEARGTWLETCTEAKVSAGCCRARGFCCDGHGQVVSWSCSCIGVGGMLCCVVRSKFVFEAREYFLEILVD